MSSQRGSIAGIVLAGVSLVTIVGAVVGLALSQSAITQDTQARVVNSPVRLVKDSAHGTRLTDRSVRIFGDFCYTQTLRTGGAETWTIFPTDERNTQLRLSAGNSQHIDQGQVTIGDGFPALCKTIDEASGTAEWIAQNVASMQPHTFSFTAYFPQKLTADYCPDVYVHYRGTWMEGLPFARISLKNLPENPCNPTPTPSTTTTPPATGTGTPAPATSTTPSATATPSATPTPTPPSISGTISVYGCKKPEDMKLFLCKDQNCQQSVSIPFNATQEKQPVAQGVWLNDSNIDRTWIYSYRITADADGNPLNPSASYRLKEAKAVFDNGVKVITSKPEELAKLSLKVGEQRDFEVFAQQTCDCNIYAEAYVKDTSGNIITEFDGKDGYGIANNNQVFDAGQISRKKFENGKIILGPGDLFALYPPDLYGRNTNSHIRLFAPGWKVVRQDCVSTGKQNACPVMAPSFSKPASELARPNVFENIGVACGVNVKYGWTLEKEATPTPTPAPAGTGDLEIHTVFYQRQQNPPSCDRSAIEPVESHDPVSSLYSHFDWGHNITIKGPVTQSQTNAAGLAHHRYNQLPTGSYNISVDMDSGRMKYMTLASNCPQTVEVKPGVTNKVTLVVYVNPGSSYKVGDEVGNTCKNCQLTEGTCGPAVGQKVLCINPGTYTPPAEPTGNGGGVCPQWCAQPSYCTSVGYVPKDIPAGQSCSNAGEKWCCPQGTEPPSGGDGGDNGGGGNGGGGNGGGSSNNKDYNSLTMVVMDADNQDAQCTINWNSDGKFKTNASNEWKKHAKGEYGCGGNVMPEDGALAVLFGNRSMEGIPDKNLISPKDGIRIMWQLFRCKDKNAFPCNQNNADDVDLMTEARDWWCLRKGGQSENNLGCYWDKSKWKTDSYVRCYIGRRSIGREVTHDRSTCSYQGDSLAAPSDTNKTFLAQSDLDENGIVNVTDVSYLIENFGKLEKEVSVPDGIQTPDVNRDGIVNSSDYAIFIKYIGLEVQK